MEEIEEIEIIESFVPRVRPQAAKWKLSDIKYNSFNQHDEGLSITGCTVTLIWEVLAANMIFPPLQLEEKG